MKIVALQAENVKKLVAVEIRPDGNLVEITGRNGQGKTSVLDSIWWALAGASHIQAAPIRKGEAKARIRLDLGEIIVTRTFARTKDGNDFTTTITVENADGARFPSPQKMLDDLLGELSFDPLAFTRMKPKDQFDALRRFVPGVDFDAIAMENKADYDRRTTANREAKEARAAAENVRIEGPVPEAAVDEAAIIAELEGASDHNSDIERRIAARERAAESIKANAENATEAEGRADELVAKAKAAAAKMIEDAEAEAASLRARASAVRGDGEALQGRLDAAPPLPEPIDASAVRVRLDEARRANAALEAANRRKGLEDKAKAAEERSTALTDAMAVREEAKKTAIAAAKMPVEGLSFGDGAVLLNEVPFDQASDAQQLRASIAIAMASNPKLRVIRVRDGSLLDEGAMKLLAELADEVDYQVWIERVDSSGKVGFVLEDGHVRSAAPAEEAA